MARKLAVAMRKGGSGKTTTTVNLAAALALRGKRVLLVDLDPQANATIAVGLNPLEPAHNVSDLFHDDALDPRAAVAKTGFGLDVLPGHAELARTEGGMQAADVYNLRSILEPLEGDYDYVIVDTPPSESFLTANALAYANEIIIPLQAHYFAMEGLAQAIDQVGKVRSGLNPEIRVIGILPTMVNPRTNISKAVLDAARQAYPRTVYPFTIDFSVKHPEATAAGVPIVLYDPNHGGSIAYNQLAEEVDGK
jgi:chromosome partitioning protein